MNEITEYAANQTDGLVKMTCCATLNGETSKALFLAVSSVRREGRDGASWKSSLATRPLPK